MLHSIDKQQIIGFLKNEIGSTIQEDPNILDENINFLKFGISSIQTITILNKINKKLKIEISPFAMFEFKNITELSDYLYQCVQTNYD